MTDVAELLDTLAPPYEGTGDWNRVLRDAKLERRPLWRPYRLAAVAALVAVIAGAVALWPASNGTGGSVLDRALAATGEGAVLHLVSEGELPRTLVDLETGERTEVRSLNEVWFDPEAGFRQTETFDGVVQFDTSSAPTRCRSTRPRSTRAWAPAIGRRWSPGGLKSSARRRSTARRSTGSRSRTATTSPCRATRSSRPTSA